MDQNRPRTRGLEASEAEEDAKFIKAALKEPEKFIKKAHQKLKSDYSRRRNNDSDDEEEKLFYQQPPFDDAEEEVAKPGNKKRRGGAGGRRGMMRRRGGKGDGEGEEGMSTRRPVSARLAALLKEELTPKIVPYHHSAIQYKHVWYKIGDVVAVQKEETKYYAQILGFHTDQFCERYASIQWLLPKWKVDVDNLPSVTMESFRGSVPEERPVSMNCFSFVFRPQSHHFQPEYPKTVSRDRFFVLDHSRIFFDSPSPTLTSAERRY